MDTDYRDRRLQKQTSEPIFILNFFLESLHIQTKEEEKKRVELIYLNGISVFLLTSFTMKKGVHERCLVLETKSYQNK